MHAVLIVEAVAKYLEEHLVDFLLEGDKGEERRITVYLYNMPDPAPAQMTAAETTAADSYEGMMPAVVVSPISYEDKALEDGCSVLTLSIMAGAFSRDPKNGNGPKTVLNILERTRRLLLTDRLVDGAYEVIEPMSWQLYDESYKPLWFGEMMTQWRIINPFRVDDFDWKGDFLKVGE